MKTPSKPVKPEPPPITMDDIARKFLTTKPKPHKPEHKPKNKEKS
jgi:hypothetical protein